MISRRLGLALVLLMSLLAVCMAVQSHGRHSAGARAGLRMQTEEAARVSAALRSNAEHTHRHKHGHKHGHKHAHAHGHAHAHAHRSSGDEEEEGGDDGVKEREPVPPAPMVETEVFPEDDKDEWPKLGPPPTLPGPPAKPAAVKPLPKMFLETASYSLSGHRTDNIKHPFPNEPLPPARGNTKPPLSSPGRWLHSMVFIGKNAFIFGGVASYSFKYWNDVWFYNIGEDEWVQQQRGYVPPFPASNLVLPRPPENEFYRPAGIPKPPPIHPEPQAKFDEDDTNKPQGLDAGMKGNKASKATAKPPVGSIKVAEQEPIPAPNEQAARRDMTDRFEQLGVSDKDRQSFAKAADAENADEERFRQNWASDDGMSRDDGLPPANTVQVIRRTGQTPNGHEWVEGAGPQRMGDLFAPTEAVTDATSTEQQEWLAGGTVKPQRFNPFRFAGQGGVMLEIAARGGQPQTRARPANGPELSFLRMFARHRQLARTRNENKMTLRDDDEEEGEGGGDDEKEDGEEKDVEGGLNLGNPEVSNMLGLIPDQMHPKFGTSFVGDELWRYNIDSRKWSLMKKKVGMGGRFPQPRWLHSACIIGGKMVIFGGVNPDSVILGDVWIYDPDANSWLESKAQGVPILPREGHSAVALGTSMVVFGGISYAYSPFNDLWTYMSAENKWNRVKASGTPPVPRWMHSAMVWAGKSGTRKMIVFGGITHQYVPLNDVHFLNLETFTWEHPETSGVAPFPRMLHAVTMVEDSMFVFGGGANNIVLEDFWHFDAGKASWEELIVPGWTPMSRMGGQLVSIVPPMNPNPYVDDRPKPQVKAAGGPPEPLIKKRPMRNRKEYSSNRFLLLFGGIAHGK